MLPAHCSTAWSPVRWTREVRQGEGRTVAVVSVAGATVTSLAALLPERTTPELLYLETRYLDDGRPLARAMLSQDRGAAITGGERADIFFGSGPEAERLAGLMKEPGRIWLLWPRGARPPAMGR